MLTDEISEIDIAGTAIDTNATAEQHVGVVELVNVGPVHHLPCFELIFYDRCSSATVLYIMLPSTVIFGSVEQ